jgi:hypothetical protein
VKQRHLKDEIKGLTGKVAKQAQTIEFLLKRIKNLKALNKEAKGHYDG